jgi:putative ABC transport system permease protein
MRRREARAAWSVRVSVWAYRRAVRAFPPRFRLEFGTELTQAFDEAAADRYRFHGARGLAGLWLQTVADLVVHAGGERWAAWRGLDPGLSLRAKRHRQIQEIRGDAGMLETLMQDARFAVRTLVKTPTFTVAIIATIGLGVGATTAIFTVVNGIVLRPLPFPDSERVVMVCETNPRTDWCGASPPNLADLTRDSRTLEAAGLGRGYPFIGELDGESFSVRGGIATPGFFRVLSLTPALGRLFEDRDMDRGANAVAIVSDAFWRQRLGADPAAVGRTVTVSGRAVTIIGVLRPDAFIPIVEDKELWEPLTGTDEDVDTRDWRGFVPFARLRPGVTMASATAELTARYAQLVQAYPEANKDWGLRLEGLRAHLVGPVSQTLWIFLGAVGFVLLIAAANVASLLLVRATGRAPEFAVRASLGAGRRRLVQQLLTESLIVAFAGGGVGLLLAVWATRVFVLLAPTGIPRLDEVSIDGRVALFAFLLSTATAIFFGFAPARRASKTDLSGTLKGLRIAGGEARLRQVFVVVELALALMLLVGAGLLMRSFGSLLAWDPGFSQEGVTFSFMLPPDSVYKTAEGIVGVMKRVRDEAATVPGVEGAAIASGGPPLFPGGDGTYAMAIDNRPPLGPDEAPPVEFYNIDSNYVRTLGVKLVRGRDLSPSDTFGAPNVALVNESLVRRYFKGDDPVGHHVTVGRHEAEIVGVVADIASFHPNEPVPPLIFWPTDQYPRGAAYLIVRARPGLDGIEKAVRARAEAVDPRIQLGSFTALLTAVRRSLVSPRFNMLLVGVFAVVAVLLAAVGVYGVIAYLVESRTREIGVRIALGATPGRIVGGVVRGGMSLAAVGLAVGLAGTLLVGRLLTSILYGTPPTDPLTLAAAVAGFALVALAAY